jgi:formiminoglutamase
VPLLLSMPHAGLDLRGLEDRLVSAWLARKDADWYVPELYAFAEDLDATIVRTDVSRTVIDVNRDPSGQSLYPGQATTELCPTTTFDGEPLYREGAVPSEAEIVERRAQYFDPYHAALRAEAARLLEQHPRIVVYDCHSIRSAVPRLFEGLLPHFNIGTNSGKACAPELARGVEKICDQSGFSVVLNGRFKGGYITRSLGAPDARLHAIQMELATRGYLHEQPGAVSETDWPPPYEPNYAALLRDVLRAILNRCIKFARSPSN